MKRVTFMIIPALICGVFFSSCDKEESDSALSIYAFAQLTTRSASSEESAFENQGLWCTGNDYVDNIDKEKEAFEPGWYQFIEQLKREGKYRK